jgi:hypothetical protein
MLWYNIGARVKGESSPHCPSNTAQESYPGAVSPTLPLRPSLALWGSCAGRPVSTPWHYAARSRTACTPHPSKEDGGTLERGTDAYHLPARGDAVTSDQWSTSPSSPSTLCGHPYHCATIPSTATPSLSLWGSGTTRRCHPRRCSSSGLPSATPSNRRMNDDRSRRHPCSHPRSRSWAGTRLATTPTGSKIRQDGQPLHDVVHHTAICSLELCGTIVNRLPLAYKWRSQSPGRRGTTDNHAFERFPPSPRYWHLALIKPQGLGGSPSSPAKLVAPLCKHHGATRYSALSTPLLDVRPTASTKIKLVS